jgi:hypothetical protein
VVKITMDKSEIIFQYISYDKNIGICEAIESIYPELDIETKIELLDQVEDLISMTYKTKAIN